MKALPSGAEAEKCNEQRILYTPDVPGIKIPPGGIPPARPIGPSQNAPTALAGLGACSVCRRAICHPQLPS
jgi:hypothetical protein